MRGCIEKHHEEGLAGEGTLKVLTVHAEVALFTCTKLEFPISLIDLAIEYQCGKIQKSQGYSGPSHVIEIFHQDAIVHEELEFEVVFSWGTLLIIILDYRCIFLLWF